jgi:predicted acylesterase/phospholipase RssA
MRKCDLVMKGGITSGIVYPAAVCELAREFQFVNIGGTSAGAIAAALTAAAEYRRQSESGSNAGFDALADLPRWLAERDGDRSRLLGLFQPAPALASLYDVALHWVGSADAPAAKMGRVIVALLRSFRRIATPIAAIGVLGEAIVLAATFALWNVHRTLAIASIVSVIVLFVLTAGACVIAAAIDALLLAMRELPRNQFGICSGMGESALTQWLADKIDAISGRTSAEPLTLGELWNAGVHLEMMATNLTHGRPYTLPFDSNVFLFARSDFERLFPERVVNWLTAHSPRTEKGENEMLYALPASADLPIILMTRMSLSFPILLSAIPLYAVDFGRRDLHAPERCWFSDGGITSNFPVHFFDAPLPRWPTFAINLAERTPRYHAPGQRIYVPYRNQGGIREWWTIFDSVPGFLWSIIATMQNWRDNMLLRIPGYRDRIAHVLLAPKEGGLNLTMDPTTIADVAARGREAAEVLRERFGANPPPDATLTWSNHKWVRFLTFMTALEESLKSAGAAFRDHTEPPSFEDLVSGAVPLPSYKLSDSERQTIGHATVDFVQHAADDFYDDPFETPKKTPRPRPVLGLRPRM